jgi:hypothetical protein
VDGPVLRRLAILFFHRRPRLTFRIRFANFRRRLDRALRQITSPIPERESKVPKKTGIK